MKEIGSVIIENFNILVDNEMKTIQSFVADDSAEKLKLNKTEAQKFAAQFEIAKHVVRNLKNITKTLNSIDDLMMLLNSSLIILSLELPTQIFTQISDDNQFVKLLKKISSFAWSVIFQNVLVSFNSMEKKIRSNTKNSASAIKERIDSKS